MTTDDRPRRNGIPLVSKRRWAQGERGGLRPISKKRRESMKDMAMNVPTKDRRCELLPLLAGVSGWIAYRNDSWHPTDPLWSVVDRHHPFSQRWHDQPWNVVLACRPVHEWCENVWCTAGQLVCMVALHRAGRFDPVEAKRRLLKCPLGTLESWMSWKLFDREAVLKLYAIELLDYYGRAA